MWSRYDIDKTTLPKEEENAHDDPPDDLYGDRNGRCPDRGWVTPTTPSGIGSIRRGRAVPDDVSDGGDVPF